MSWDSSILVRHAWSNLVAARWEPGGVVIGKACKAGAGFAQGAGILAGWWMQMSHAKLVPVPARWASSCSTQSWSLAGPEVQCSGHPTHRCGSAGPEGWVLNNIQTKNVTLVSEFHLKELSEDPDLQPLLFGLFLSMYLVTVLGNLFIILAVSSDFHLHTPMYFFLSILSLADICFISTTVPKMIVNIQTHSRVISYMGCLTQMSLFIIFACMDSMILAVMAYDRFVAICHPLHYSVIMNPRFCVFLVLGSFSLSLFESQLHDLIFLQLTCFKDVEIGNFFCHPSQLLNLTCTDGFSNSIIMYVIGVILGVFPISGILFSYYRIISSILKIPSSGGRYKAFSTCGSHLLVVCLFYGTGLGEYFGSVVSCSSRNNSVASLMYTVVTPMLNPFIYSLRNREIISALKKLQNRIVYPRVVWHPFRM
ncbi:olfactory receptor 7E24-like [Castor canadensis]|uniref:Olfactory receptor 7E24-like n=1 Tax=Castor canadensis TaxID=51338 RepID=A0AC58KWV6_CASCN